MDNAFTRGDRTVGFVLLALSIVVALVPRFELAGHPISPYLVASVWLCAAILLLTSPYAGRPMPWLIRRGAAILFVLGLAAPFIANLINKFVGA